MKLVISKVDLTAFGADDTYFYVKEGSGALDEIVFEGERIDMTDIHALLAVYNALVLIKNDYSEASNSASIFGALNLNDIVNPIVKAATAEIDALLEEINDLMNEARPTAAEEPKIDEGYENRYKQCYQIAMRFMEEQVDPHREIPYEQYYNMVDALVKYNMWVLSL